MLLQADARRIPLADESVQCCVTSPPYFGLRNYEVDGQIGLEKTPEEYVRNIVEVFREIRRVLRKDGTVWLNLGDSYQGGNRGGYERERSGVSKNLGSGTNGADFRAAPNRFPLPGLKPKDLCMIPARVALALQADGWWLRSDIIWSKKNPMPGSQQDRPTTSHEYLFLLAKSGSKILWRNSRTKAWVRQKPKPHWTRVKPRANANRSQTWERDGPVSEHVIPGQQYAQHRKDRNKVKWVNLWRGRDYYYEGDEIRELVAPSQVGRERDDIFGGKSWVERGQHSEGGRYSTNGKHSTQDPQSSGRRIVEAVKRARLNGADHDQPFGQWRTKRSVWECNTRGFSEAHFATFPEDLIKPCILAGCPPGGIVLDPFVGSGTTVKVAQDLGRIGIGLDLKVDYLLMAKRRAAQQGMVLPARGADFFSLDV